MFVWAAIVGLLVLFIFQSFKIKSINKQLEVAAETAKLQGQLGRVLSQAVNKHDESIRKVEEEIPQIVSEIDNLRGE